MCLFLEMMGRAFALVKDSSYLEYGLGARARQSVHGSNETQSFGDLFRLLAAVGFGPERMVFRRSRRRRNTQSKIFRVGFRERLQSPILHMPIVKPGNSLDSWIRVPLAKNNS